MAIFLSGRRSNCGANDSIKSLVESCLECFAINFHRFNNIFLSTEDSRLRKTFVFIQRVYTQQLILSLNKKIKKEYVNFFLNDHLKCFDLSWFERSDFPVIVEKVKEIGHTFLKMNLVSKWHDHFPNHFAFQEICEILPSSPNVEQLSLPSYVNNNVLSVLVASCQKLKVLRFNNEKGDFAYEDFYQVLKNIPTLQLVNLKELPRILYLAHKQDYQNNVLNTVNKNNLVKLNFTDLIEEFYDFCDPDFTDILIVCSELCPHVKSIVVHVLCQKHLDLLTAFQELQYLNIKGGRSYFNSNLNVNQLLKLRADKLIAISLQKCHVSIFSILECSKLKFLELDSIVLDNICHTKSYLLTDLKKLTIRNVVFENSLNFSTFANFLQLVLSSSPHLLVLSLIDCDIKNSLPQSIILESCSNIDLKVIYFENSIGVTAEFVKSIVETCKHECKLQLEDCSPIEEHEVEVIKTIDSKVRLFFSKSYFEDDNNICSRDVDFHDCDD